MAQARANRQRSTSSGAKRGPGRPSTYDESKVAELLRRMAEGDSLKGICREDGMPSAGAVLAWVLDDRPPGIADRYARARKLQAERWAEEIVTISDEATDRDSAAAAKVRVDARKWVACKLIPHQYGDRVDVTSGGEKVTAGVLVVPGVAADKAWAEAAAAQQRELEANASAAGKRAAE